MNSLLFSMPLKPYLPGPSKKAFALFFNDRTQPMNNSSFSFRTTAAAVIALTVASLVAPSMAHAKRMGGGKSAPSSFNRTPAAAPAAAARPAAPPAAAAAAPAAAAPAAAGPGLGSTLGAAVVGGVVGSMAGSALAGSMSSPEKEAAKAKQAEAAAAEKEAQDLQRKADEAKAKAEAARAAAK